MQGQVRAVAVPLTVVASEILCDLGHSLLFQTPPGVSASAHSTPVSYWVHFAFEEAALPSPTNEIFIVRQGLAQINTAFSLTFFCDFPLVHLNGSCYLNPLAHCWYILYDIFPVLPFIIKLFPWCALPMGCRLLDGRGLSCLSRIFLIACFPVSEKWRQTGKPPLLITHSSCQLLWGGALAFISQQP